MTTTHCTTKVHDGFYYDSILVNVHNEFGFGSVPGKVHQEFLKQQIELKGKRFSYTCSSQFCWPTLGQLAFDLVLFLNTQGNTGVSLEPTSFSSQYDYHIFTDSGGTLKLYEVNSAKYLDIYEKEAPKYKRIVEFVYPSTSSEYPYTVENNWRKLGVTEEDSTYIKGIDLLDASHPFKNFRKDKVVGGTTRIFEVKA